MLPKQHFSGALVVSLALTLGGVPSVAHASTAAQVTLTEKGYYACVGPCTLTSAFSSGGIAHSASKDFRTMTFSGVGIALPATTPAPPKCFPQQSYDAFTSQNGKNTLFLSTTSDYFCPGPGNISVELATFTITGGTGIYSSATGTATANFTVLTHPQNATGTFTLAITY